MRFLLLILLLLAACAPDKPVKKAEAPDDGCVGYRIMPDGEKRCVAKK
jgi:hypothetical protein